MLTITGERLRDLYDLTDVYFNNDDGLQIVINSIIEEKNKQKISDYKKLIFKEI